MRSVLAALTWEMLARGRWSLPTFALGANVLPVLLFTALRFQGVVDVDDPSMLAMQVVLVQVNLLTFGAAVMDAQGQPTRLYALPISTESLVAWQMLPAMLIAGLQSLISITCLNAVFHLNWPLWGPTLFAATGITAIQAAMWSTEKSGWMPLAFIIPGAIMSLWFKSRFGPIVGLPIHQWLSVTPAEIITLLGFAGVSYGTAVAGVARRRCGEPLPSLGIIAWLERVLDPAPDVGAPFATPAQAQFWFEWRKKGWLLPATVLVGMLIGLGIWVCFVRTMNDLFEGFVGGGAMLALLGFCGFFLGNVGPDDKTFEIGHFLGTRPLTNSELSRITLKVLARSILTAWVIWAVPFVALFAFFSLRGNIPRVDLLKDVGWWFLPGTLLCSWTGTAVTSCLAMMGRPERLAVVVCGSIAGPLALQCFSEFVLPPEARMLFIRSCLLVAAIVLAAGTVWAFARARRQALIGRSTVIASVCFWSVLSGLIVLDWTLHPARPWLLGVIAVTFAALTVAPLAAAPLALASNRNR